MADGAAAAGPRPRPAMLLALLAVAAIVGLVVSFASWGFLESVHLIQEGVFVDLPRDLGYDDGAPVWWPLAVLALAGLVAAFAIVRLPGHGGPSPAGGLGTGTTRPIELPGVLLAAVATIGLGVVLGPEGPVIALGSGLGGLGGAVVRRRARPGAPRGRRRGQFRGGLVHLRVTAGRRGHPDRGGRAGSPPPDGA